MKKLLFATLIALALTACSKGDTPDNGALIEPPQSTEKDFSETRIDLDIVVKNENARGYNLYLMAPGVYIPNPDPEDRIHPHEYIGPFEFENGSYNLLNTFEISSYLKQKNTDKLEVFVAAKEDLFILNPLNEQIFLEFEQDETSFNGYFMKTNHINLPIKDQFPDGVASIIYPDADFIVKLDFDILGDNQETYVVGIDFDPNPSIISGVSAVVHGHTYFEAPFYHEMDDLANHTGTIYVQYIGATELLNYDNSPIVVTFDEKGQPAGDNLITISVQE